MYDLDKILRFYFITDDGVADFPPAEQAKIAIQSGASIVQYRNKFFSSAFLDEAKAVREICKRCGVPFVVNDNIELAKATNADGVHVGQEDESPKTAREILGSGAIVGVSVSDFEELEKTDLQYCDYMGTGAVFPTGTKKDVKNVCGLSGLEAISKKTSIPVVAIGGIDSGNAGQCFAHGAAGVAVISFVTRAANPMRKALELGAVCGCSPRSPKRPPRF